MREEMNRADRIRRRQAAEQCRLRPANPATPPRVVPGGHPSLAGTAPQAAGGAAARGKARRARQRQRPCRRVQSLPAYDPDDLEEAPGAEAEAVEEQIVDQATAAATLAELEAEIVILT